MAGRPTVLEETQLDIGFFNPGRPASILGTRCSVLHLHILILKREGSRRWPRARNDPAENHGNPSNPDLSQPWRRVYCLHRGEKNAPMSFGSGFRGAVPSDTNITAEIWSLGARDRDQLLEGALSEFETHKLTAALTAFLRA